MKVSHYYKRRPRFFEKKKIFSPWLVIGALKKSFKAISFRTALIKVCSLDKGFWEYYVDISAAKS